MLASLVVVRAAPQEGLHRSALALTPAVPFHDTPHSAQPPQAIGTATSHHVLAAATRHARGRQKANRQQLRDRRCPSVGGNTTTCTEGCAAIAAQQKGALSTSVLRGAHVTFEIESPADLSADLLVKKLIASGGAHAATSFLL